MEKVEPQITNTAWPEDIEASRRSQRSTAKTVWRRMALGLILLYFSSRYLRLGHHVGRHFCPHAPSGSSPYGTFPRVTDPFHYMPCTNRTVPPALDDAHPEVTWASRFDTDPANWSWGNETTPAPGSSSQDHEYRGIYLCGYLDVPLDHLNSSDRRIVRLAVTKYQVSGLERTDGRSPMGAGLKSERTLFIEPGGPGGSGTSYVWRAAEKVSRIYSDRQYDVFGWDPRGVNASQPAVSCFPHDVDRDHWSLLTSRNRKAVGNPRQQLQMADAMNEAVFRACHEVHGDVPRFLNTAYVARDLEVLRKTNGEDELNGVFVSYGTGIGQTWANMFPDSVGRLILDGTEYVRDHRLVGGFGWTSLDNVTNAWHDGFLGECIEAGPEFCALAKPLEDGKAVTLESLQSRLEAFINTLITRPIPAFTDATGPSLITYSSLVQALYGSLYRPVSWDAAAEMLYELERGNATLAAEFLEKGRWEYDPTVPTPPGKKPSSDELGDMVICGDAGDASFPEEGLDWYDSLWANMTEQSWLSGDSRFLGSVLPCRHFAKHWPDVPGLYRGDLNHTLRTPVLLIAESYDPATPLRNGRRLLEEMGGNARLIHHHGYGHSSADRSNCTDHIARRYILKGELPEKSETDCYANEKPYRYAENGKASQKKDVREVWDEHMQELAVHHRLRR